MCVCPCVCACVCVHACVCVCVCVCALVHLLWRDVKGDSSQVDYTHIVDAWQDEKYAYPQRAMPSHTKPTCTCRNKCTWSFCLFRNKSSQSQNHSPLIFLHNLRSHDISVSALIHSVHVCIYMHVAIKKKYGCKRVHTFTLQRREKGKRKMTIRKEKKARM